MCPADPSDEQPRERAPLGYRRPRSIRAQMSVGQFPLAVRWLRPFAVAAPPASTRAAAEQRTVGRGVPPALVVPPLVAFSRRPRQMWAPFRVFLQPVPQRALPLRGVWT